MSKPDALLDREPDGDYRPSRWNRLQTHDALNGTLWIGDPGEPMGRCQVQSVWVAAEDFRRYVNKLIDTFGHLTYAELQAMQSDEQKSQEQST